MSYERYEKKEERVTVTSEIYLREGGRQIIKGPVGPKVGDGGVVFFKGFQRSLLVPLENINYVEITNEPRTEAD